MACIINHYKPLTIINDDSRVVNKLESSLNDNTRVVIYDCHMFIVQSTEAEFLVVCDPSMNEL